MDMVQSLILRTFEMLYKGKNISLGNLMTVNIMRYNSLMGETNVKI